MNDLDEMRLSRDNAVEFSRQMLAQNEDLKARLAASEARVKSLESGEDPDYPWARAIKTAERKREEAERALAEARAKMNEQYNLILDLRTSSLSLLPPANQSPLTPEKFDAMAKAMYENEKNQPNPLPYNPLPPAKKSQEKSL